MPSYRYLFTRYDAYDEILAVLPVVGGTFERIINRPGTFTGARIPITSAELGDKCRELFGDGLDGIRVPPRRIMIERDGEIWWAGIVWKITPRGDRNGKVWLDLAAASLESVPFHRQIRDDVQYVAEDQVEIMINMWMRMQWDLPGGFLNVHLPYGQLSGVLRDRTEWVESAGKTYGEAFEQLAEVENGFEFTIDTFWHDDHIDTELRIGYPRLGQVGSDHTFNKPGNLLSYSWPDDKSHGGTSFQARGGTSPQSTAAEAEPLMSSVHVAQDLLDEGWPLLDYLNTEHSSVTEVATLDEVAMADRDALAGGLAVPEVTVRLVDTGLTPAHIGDHARFTIIDEWFTERVVDGRVVPRLDVRRRIVGMQVTPEDHEGQEVAKLILEEVDSAAT